jgi:hypothetical protein
MAESPEGAAAEAPRASTKDLFEKFGLTEVLGYIFPGVIVLCSAVIWGVPQPSKILGDDIAKSPLAVSLIIIILAYAIGHIVSMWSLQGANAPPPPRPDLGPGWEGRAIYYCRLARWKFVLSTVRMSDPSPACIDAYLDISDLLTSFFGVQGMKLLQRLNEQLSVLRALAGDDQRDRIANLIAEAEIVERRIMFSLGAALALLIVAGFAILRLCFYAYWKLVWFPSRAEYWNAQHPVSIAVLIVVIIGCIYTSAKLRRVAAYCREHELALCVAIKIRLS